MAREKVEFDVVGNDKGGSKVFNDNAAAAAKAGRAVDDLKDELRQLDTQVVKSRAELALLAREFAKTGDQDIWKGIRQQKSELRKLLDARKLMEDAGDDGAQGFAAGFSTRIGPLLAKAPLSPALLAALAPAIPVAASAIAGGVTLGLAGGAVAAGVKLAFQDPTVKAEAKSFGDEIGFILRGAARPFVPATRDAIATARAEFRGLDDELEAIFADAADYLMPLTRGAAGFAREFAPGLRDAVRNAQPLIELAEEHLPAAGDALSSAMRDLSAAAEDSKATLDAALTLTEASVVATGKITQFLSSPLASGGNSRLIQDLIGWLSDSGDEAEQAAGQTAAYNLQLAQMSVTIPPLAEDFRTFTEKLDDWTNANLGAENANLRLQEAIDAATAAGKKNNDGIDANTAKGRANRQILIQLAEAANANAQAIFEQTGSTEKANAATAAARKQFILSALAMGASAAEAERLAGMLFGIPTETKTTHKSNSPQAKAEADRVRAKLEAIEGTYFARVVVSYTEKGSRGGIGNSGFKGQSEGGLISGPGTGTSDDIIRRVSNGEYVVRAAAVQTLGVDVLDRINQADRVGAGAARTPRVGALPAVSAATGTADLDYQARAFARELAKMTFRIDDRGGRFVDLLTRGG